MKRWGRIGTTVAAGAVLALTSVAGAGAAGTEVETFGQDSFGQLGNGSAHGLLSADAEHSFGRRIPVRHQPTLIDRYDRVVGAVEDQLRHMSSHRIRQLSTARPNGRTGASPRRLLDWEPRSMRD